MTSSAAFRINAPHVIGEVIDDEAIIVNLESGAYYSLRNAGAEAWRLLAGSASMGQVAERIALLFEADPATIEDAVGRLFADLQAEQLIVSADAATEAPALPDVSGPRRAFEAPTLEKFTDMADLLLLDPIHEVSPRGWPNRDDSPQR